MLKVKSEKTFAPYDYLVKPLLPLIPAKLMPNHLTFVRLLLSPVLMGLLYFGYYKIGLVLFSVLALTDMFDGSIARLRDQITVWGELWDPIADKILIGGTVFVLLIKVNFALTIFILAFELAFILGGAFLTLGQEVVILKSNMWGKIKLNLQVLGGILLIFGFILNLPNLVYMAEISFYSSLFFAMASLIKRGI